MKFSQKSKLSAIAAITAFVGRAQAVGDCDGGGPWNSNPVGYDTGGEWCATKWMDGAAINGIQGWANGDSVNGIEFQYTNGVAPERFGQMTGDKKEWLSWDTTTDTVESITMWPNGRSDVRRVAAIEIKISNRDPWRIGTVPPNTQGYDSPVVQNAGIIMGAYGRQGGSIDALGFLMLDSAIKNRDVKDFALDGDSVNGNNEALKNQKPEAIDSFSQENWTGGNMTYQVDRRIEKTRSWSTTRTSSKTFGGSVGASIDFGLPAIGLGGSVTTEFHWETTSTWENTEEGSDTTELFFSVSGKIPKGEAIYCEALAFSGKYDLDYGSTIDLELQSGRTWSYHEAGTVKGVAWSKNENKCISYKEGESGPAVLEAKLAEWKANPEKEAQEEQEREERAEDSVKEPEPTTIASATPSKTKGATPSKTKEPTPTETGDSDEPIDDEDEDDEPVDDEDEDEDDEPVDDEDDETVDDEDEDEEPIDDEDEDADLDDEDEDVEDEDEDLEDGDEDVEDNDDLEDEPADDEDLEEEPVDDEDLEDEPVDDEDSEDEPADDEDLEDEPLDDEEAEEEDTTTARASTTTKRNTARAEMTPAPTAVEGKRSMFFFA